MSIATEIQRLQTAKAAIRQAIRDKGIPVSSSDKLDSFASKIRQIPSTTIRNYDRTIELESDDIGSHFYQIPSGYTGHGDIIVKIVAPRVTLSCGKITAVITANGQTTFNLVNFKLKLYNGNTLIHTWTFNNAVTTDGTVTITSNEDTAIIRTAKSTNNLTLSIEGGINLSGYDYLTIQEVYFFGSRIECLFDPNRDFLIGNVQTSGNSPAQINIDFSPSAV